MSQLLAQKVAIVTGSSSGIGRAIALAFHREGAIVVCADLVEKHGDLGTHEEIRNNGGTSVFQRTDVTQAKDLEALVHSTVVKFSRLDIMVNNAGIAIEAEHPSPIWSFDEENWDKSLAVNVKGVFLGCKYASEQMIKQEPGPTGDRGWIINLGSIVGTVAAPHAVSYVASKHAVLGITKTAALDCAPYRVHCNAVCPGWVSTPMTQNFFDRMKNDLEKLHPFRGLGTPEDIAHAVVFLASERNTWMTGAAMMVDGGFTSM